MTTPTAARFDAANAPLTTVIDAVDPEAWSRPSPCDDWDARAVVAHLIGTQRDFFERQGIELGDAPAVDADPGRAWHDHVAGVRPLLDDPAVVDRAFDGWFGPTTIGETIVRFYVMDMIAHRWDLARAVGAGAAFTDSELDQLEVDVDGYGDAAYAPGVFKPGIEAPADADRQTRVLARMGRIA